jgi:hypothetical protein
MKDELEPKGLSLQEQAICHEKWDRAFHENPKFLNNFNILFYAKRRRLRSGWRRWAKLCHRSGQSLQVQRKPLHKGVSLELKFLNWFQAQFIDAIEKGLVAHFKVLGSDLPVPVSFLKCAQDRLPFRLQNIGLRYLF